MFLTFFGFTFTRAVEKKIKNENGAKILIYTSFEKYYLFDINAETYNGSGGILKDIQNEF